MAFTTNVRLYCKQSYLPQTDAPAQQEPKAKSISWTQFLKNAVASARSSLASLCRYFCRSSQLKTDQTLAPAPIKLAVLGVRGARPISLNEMSNRAKDIAFDKRHEQTPTASSRWFQEAARLRAQKDGQ
jgi:hypothetical protein